MNKRTPPTHHLNTAFSGKSLINKSNPIVLETISSLERSLHPVCESVYICNGTFHGKDPAVNSLLNGEADDGVQQNKVDPQANEFLGPANDVLQPMAA